MAIGNKPFQYYIKLTKKGNPVVGLNISKFDRKIENAVAKAKYLQQNMKFQLMK